jgi:hypothetical protein
MGIPVIYVERCGRVHYLSLSARLASPAVSRLFVQWHESRRAPPEGRVRRDAAVILVVLVTHDQPFRARFAWPPS